MKLVLLLFFCLTLISCNTAQSQIIKKIKTSENKTISEDILKEWYLLDPIEDSLPGISLKKSLEFLHRKRKKEVVIGVIDATVDINHDYFKNIIWSNQNEKLNGIDDDNNGYIDDINGWNFLGNKEGSLPQYENYEVVRIVRRYNNFFTTNDSLAKENLNKYLLFKKARKDLKEERQSLKKIIKGGQEFIDNYNVALDTITPYLKNKELSIEALQKLLETNKNFENEINALMLPLKYDMNISDVEDDLDFQKRLLNIYYNTNFEERLEVGDNPNNFSDRSYGNNLVSGLKDTISHGTNVTGIIATNFKKNNMPMGIVNHAKIIPVIVAVNGNAHDKDLALGIRYAVDMGASILNISISKEYSLHKEWVFDAISYAASKDVLVIVAAGNDNLNLDKEKNFFPNDTDYNMPEISDNFIMVGGITHKIGEELKYNYSNYGKETVDIMAPAKNISVLTSNNEYEFANGTSFAAPVVSGVAGLIRSYYPNLKANEIKSILMESGVSFNGLVNLAESGDEKKLVPFSSLSKSGKIVNAYNALILADKITKNN